MTELGTSKGRRHSFTFLKRRFQRKRCNVNHGLDVLSHVVLTLWSGDYFPSADSKINSKRFANALKVTQQVNQSPALAPVGLKSNSTIGTSTSLLFPLATPFVKLVRNHAPWKEAVTRDNQRCQGISNTRNLNLGIDTGYHKNKDTHPKMVISHWMFLSAIILLYLHLHNIKKIKLFVVYMLTKLVIEILSNLVTTNLLS